MAASPNTEPEAAPGWDRFVVLGLVSIVLVGLFLWSLAAAPGMLSRLWSDDLAGLPEELASSRIGMLAQLGDAGIPSLVDALGNSRESVSMAARAALRDELARWRLLPAEESTPKIARLVECLSERVVHWRPEQRRIAAEIAQAALAWQCAGEEVDRTRIVEQCDSILRLAATTNQERFAAHAVVGDEGAENPRLAWDDRPHTAGEQVRGVAYEELASLPGGDLPFDIAQIPALSGPRNVLPDPLSGLGPAPLSVPATSSAELPPRLIRPQDARPIAPNVPGTDFAAEDPSTLDRFESRPNEPLKIRTRVEPEEIRWMRQLVSTDPALAEAARKELQSRGFDATALQVAGRLVDSDPEVRRALCNDLPRIPQFDARAWLLWLADDPDSGVRAAARAILATSPDADLLRRVDNAGPEENLRR